MCDARNLGSRDAASRTGGREAEKRAAWEKLTNGVQGQKWLGIQENSISAKRDFLLDLFIRPWSIRIHYSYRLLVKRAKTCDTSDRSQPRGVLIDGVRFQKSPTPMWSFYR